MQLYFTLTQLSMQLFLLHFDAGHVHYVYVTSRRSVVDIAVAGQVSFTAGADAGHVV
jgi:hypothetical protein